MKQLFEPLEVSLVDTISGVLFPLTMTWMALSRLRSPSDRSLVLPTPIMMYVVFMTRGSACAWYWTLLGTLGWLTLLGGCLRGNRGVASGAAICCGGISVVQQLTSLLSSSP